MTYFWTAEQLLAVLTEQAGLPAADRPASLDVTFAQIGLDSLAYLQLQSTVSDELGVELAEEPPADYTLEQILTDVNTALADREVA